MRIIKVKTLLDHLTISRYKNAEKALLAWVSEVKYKNASIISSKRVVFNIKGNGYRLIVDIEYNLKIVFIAWFGTHKEYNKIDAKEVSYESQGD